MNKEGEMKILENGVFLPIDLDLGIKSYAKAFNNQITGQVFLYTDKQLFLLSFKGKKASTKLILENFDFDTKQIYSIYFDQKNDILYLGSITKGLCIIKKQYFENIPTSTRDKNFVEYSLNKLNDSTILTSTGIKIQNRKFLGHNNAIFENSTRNIAQVDTDGNFWVSKGRTLNKFYASTAYTSHDSIVFSEKVRAALITGNQFFIGTGPERNYNRKGALFSLNPNNPVDVAPKLLSNTSSAISALEKFNDSILLVGTHDGLFTYNSNTLNLVEVEGMEERQIRSIYKSGNEFWITTYSHGFFLYKDSKIRSVPLDLKKHLSTAHCIVEDDKGYFWITTNKGIFQVLKKDLTNYINKKSERIYYHYYDKSAGFSNNEFNGSGCPCGVKLLNHDIIFPSLEGLVTFNSYDINPIIPDNDIYIDEVVVDGRHRFVGDTLTLQKTDRITFQITSPFYGNPYNNQIEVQMDDGIWEPIGTSRTQSYTNLAPGKHSIKARKLAGFNSDYRYTSLNIYVTPTFWQSTLFKVLSIVLLLFLIYLIIGLRTRYITKKNIQLEKKIHEHTLQLQQTVIILREAKEKLRNQVSQQKKLVTAITHDVKTPLRFMALTSKLSFESFEHRSPEELRESTKAMFTSSYQLYHFIENVLDYSFISLDNEKLDNSGFTLSDLIQEKINFFGHISNSRKIKVSNRIPNGLTLPYNQQLFSIIIHNLLDNSIKHTYDGEIFFWHKQDGERFILNVQDTGSGMTTETLIQLNAQKKSITNGTNDHRDKQKGFGMTIVMELLLMLEGDIIIESQLRKGTKISMLFKTGL
ncbi:ATP-binding protein [Flagellimonas oceanensis]|uniref:sensor histidine kinase n=1 Tax=Flagellimonas oceanensis TaxID=2499163 RepID=UPI001F388D27|nr:ATP-binding protein [Allomuricauda oceanensis]